MTDRARPAVLLIAGFGDNASMYAPLLELPLAMQFDLVPLDLPGFGAPSLPCTTNLRNLGEWVAEQAHFRNAQAIVAHSVASIIASFAASAKGSPLKQIISLEGNLTSVDAYFSGRAHEHASPESFQAWFLPRLEKNSVRDTVLARYLEQVRMADPVALWELGCDAHEFSQEQHPGKLLEASAKVTYVVNRENCAAASMQWLDQSELQVEELAEASHWPSIDQPEALACVLERALRS